MENVIEINDLVKNFGEIKAVQSLGFKVKKGELFAFLGLNGAGKSTTISIMCGLLKKDGGKVFICGSDIDRDMDKIKNRLGIVFQNSVLDKVLSVKDNLKNRAALYGIRGKAFEERLKELSALLSIDDILKRPVGKLSGGQRRRADIARALLHRPEILILDEPTTGLDPQTRKNVWEAVEKLRKEEGMTVFLTTHYMEEAADADYVIILDSGKIAAEGTPLYLKNTYTGDFLTVYGVSESDMQAIPFPYESVNGGYRISVSDTLEAARLIRDNPGLFKDFEVTKGKMDDVFLAVTGKRLSGGGQ